MWLSLLCSEIVKTRRRRTWRKLPHDEGKGEEASVSTRLLWGILWNEGIWGFGYPAKVPDGAVDDWGQLQLLYDARYFLVEICFLIALAHLTTFYLKSQVTTTLLPMFFVHH